MSFAAMGETIQRGRQRIGLSGKGAGAWSRIGVSVLLVAGVTAFAAPATADGGDYKLDFTAAAPFTYDHATGGGAFNQRDVGVNDDIVESLEGGQFECGDIVTYLTQIRRDGTLGDPGRDETLELQYSFLADTTGQSGVAMIDVVDVSLNNTLVQNGDLNPLPPTDPPAQYPLGFDSGYTAGGGEVVEDWVEFDNDIPLFTKGAEIGVRVQVSGIEPGERVVLRVDVLLGCNEPRPTGNLQAQLNYTDVVESTTPGLDLPDSVPGGEQTVPFKQVGSIYPVACPEQDWVYEGQDPSCNEGLETNPNPPSPDEGTDQQGDIALVSTVTDLVSDNPQISTMSMAGGVLAFVALRRRRPGTGR